MTNDETMWRRVQGAIWIACALLLATALAGELGPGGAATAAVSIIGVAATTSYSAIALGDCRKLGRGRWLVVGAVIILASSGGHALFVRLGLRETLLQEVINFTVIVGIAFALRQARLGYLARRTLSAETSLRRLAEERLNQALELLSKDAGPIPFKVGRAEMMIDPALISHIGAQGNYTTVYMTDGSVFASETIQAMSLRLQQYGFTRVHRSFAVNKSFIRSRQTGYLTLIDGQIIPVGRVYRS